ncbi:MAG TPA: group 1 truncated hemoglobin [Usitatibacter sp.]|nr:group 1 truncated hemoglobin [Usitatibacter sp.]
MSPTATAVATRTLYERLGGNPGITAIVSDIVDAHIANPVVGRHFSKLKDVALTKRMARDFFCAGAGGPEKYAGKDMRAAHKGMNINDDEFDAVVDDVMVVLTRHGIDEATKKDVLGILHSLKSEVVGL